MIDETFRFDLFAGKVVLVVGGPSGIGAGIADAFPELGTVVTLAQPSCRMKRKLMGRAGIIADQRRGKRHMSARDRERSRDLRGLRRLANWARKIFMRDISEPSTCVSEFDRVKASWEVLGEHDPLWAIVSVPDKRGNRWNRDEFFATGVREIGNVFDTLNSLGVGVTRGRALDFGSGVGRLTQALASEFRHVDGIEVAATMLLQARALNRHGDRVTYLEGKSDGLPCADAIYDFVFSKIVLQHLAIQLQRMYVCEFLRVLRPGGIAMFQTPARALEEEGTQFRTPVETPQGTVTIDMNVFPRADVERTVREAGGQLLHALPDGSSGEKFESLLYIATR